MGRKSLGQRQSPAKINKIRKRKRKKREETSEQEKEKQVKKDK